MKQINKIVLSIESTDPNKVIAEKTVSAFLEGYLNKVNTADMNCAVSEAINNCFDHAYRDKVGVITVTMQAYDNNQVKIIIEDKGCGIADIKQASCPLYTSLPDDEHSGMGITVMENFADKITIKSTVGKGTVVTLTKK